jgi:peptidoglycan hydrolase-like protein with peptidoglycan-binding domain
MQVLESHGKAPIRLRPWVFVVAAIIVIALVVALTGSSGTPSRARHGSAGGGGGGSGSGTSATGTPLSLTSSSPASGAVDVPSNSAISLSFSTPVTLGTVAPTLTPPVAGTWVRSNSTTLTYDLAAPLVPSTKEVISIPGGAHGLTALDGRTLPHTASYAFTVASGDPQRLQQLLARLDYLPLSFTPSGKATAPKDAAQVQAGSFAWKWSTLPTELTSLWTQGSVDSITKAAVESFQSQNGLPVDGDAGPAVWTALLHDVAVGKVASTPYIYVLVSKVIPETLTLYNNGTPQYSHILVNTGTRGADTVDGTFAVFEHVRFSEMKGTNPDGSKYDDPNVPYASYFNGGDALHGFIRSSYGSPQSNGCVEMAYVNAALVWPLTPIGTLVTVEGPASPPLPPTTTTSSTTSTTTSTTMVSGAPTTTTAPPTTTTAPG